MNNSNLYILNFEKTDLCIVINNFIEKIKQFGKEENLHNLFEKTNKLIDSLIDICIKNKINYFLENHISFTSIKINFKMELENNILDIIKKHYPNINTEIDNLSIDNFNKIKTLDNFNDFMYGLINNTKTKVTFNTFASEYTFKKEEENKKINKKKIKSVKINFCEEKNDLSIENKLGILIKILFMNNNDIKDFQIKILEMCKIINDNEIEYDIFKPYKNKS